MVGISVEGWKCYTYVGNRCKTVSNCKVAFQISYEKRTTKGVNCWDTVPENDCCVDYSYFDVIDPPILSVDGKMIVENTQKIEECLSKIKPISMEDCKISKSVNDQKTTSLTTSNTSPSTTSNDSKVTTENISVTTPTSKGYNWEATETSTSIVEDTDSITDTVSITNENTEFSVDTIHSCQIQLNDQPNCEINEELTTTFQNSLQDLGYIDGPNHYLISSNSYDCNKIFTGNDGNNYMVVHYDISLKPHEFCHINDMPQSDISLTPNFMSDGHLKNYCCNNLIFVICFIIVKLLF